MAHGSRLGESTAGSHLLVLFQTSAMSRSDRNRAAAVIIRRMTEETLEKLAIRELVELDRVARRRIGIGFGPYGTTMDG